MAATGDSSTKLVVLRGNSACGKSTTARALRERLGGGIALVEQDYLRRVLLYEHDVVDGNNIGLIDVTALVQRRRFPECRGRTDHRRAQLGK